MARLLQFEVIGKPGPQGSKRHVGNGIMIESSPDVKPWRQAVAWCCKEATMKYGWEITNEPVHLSIVFYLLRPTGHCGKKGLKPSAPKYPNVKPDLDKLLRSTCDGIKDSHCVYTDDSKVVHIRDAWKVYAENGHWQGALIKITVENE